ncbi:MAG: hypothetical protein J6Y20_07270 [Lachnospiraceae bacterium]|nr:hypothetical protein [Lachnospiraceae bacterium]
MRLTIKLPPVTKKNSTQIVTVKDKRTGNARTIQLPSKPYQEYERNSGWFIPADCRVGINYPVTVKALFYMQTRRRVDKSNLEEALHDVLVYYGVLEDDNRDIIASTDGSRVYYDKANPRTEVEITPLEEEYTQWRGEGMK